MRRHMNRAELETLVAFVLTAPKNMVPCDCSGFEHRKDIGGRMYHWIYTDALLPLKASRFLRDIGLVYTKPAALK